MIDNDKISNTQLWMFMVLSMIGIGVFSLPRLVADATKTDGWITTILGGLAALADFYIISRLARKFPGDTVVEMANKILGKFLAVPVLIIFWLHFLSAMAGVLRIFAEVLKMTLLLRTPVEIIMISLLVCVLILARCGIEAIVRFDESVFIILFIMSVIGIVLALPGADLTNIRPFMTSDIKDFLYGAYQTSFSYSGFELVLLIIPFINKPHRILSSGVIAFTVVILSYTLVVILSFGYFGLAEVKELIWPTLSLIRSIEVPGSFVERLEGIVMTQWILFAFTSLVAFLYGTAVLSSRTLKNKEFKHFCSIILPFVYIIALLPDNVPAVYEFLDNMVLYVGIPSLFVFPLLLLIVSYIRKIGESENV